MWLNWGQHLTRTITPLRNRCLICCPHSARTALKVTTGRSTHSNTIWWVIVTYNRVGLQLGSHSHLTHSQRYGPSVSVSIWPCHATHNYLLFNEQTWSPIWTPIHLHQRSRAVIYIPLRYDTPDLDQFICAGRQWQIQCILIRMNIVMQLINYISSFRFSSPSPVQPLNRRISSQNDTASN